MKGSTRASSDTKDKKKLQFDPNVDVRKPTPEPTVLGKSMQALGLQSRQEWEDTKINIKEQERQTKIKKAVTNYDIGEFRVRLFSIPVS